MYPYRNLEDWRKGQYQGNCYIEGGRIYGEDKKTGKTPTEWRTECPLKVLIIAQKSFFLGLLGCYKHFFIIFARKKQ